ncbi:T9SS type A sorting domain-containing protein, partial [Rubrivirga sp.]|uniref:T9SS type A sorting domain-containing protein n=1 Tax=Rubrivirga sp. TaxID=1885344 RepID=UPI003C7477A0
PDAGVATLEVFDALGRRVVVLEDGGRSPGWHRIEVGQKLPAGAYLVRLRVETGGALEVETQSLVVVR